MWTKGTIEILGGRFLDNRAKDSGGVIMSADESITIIADGEFEGNKASDGGVVYVGSESNLSVSDGVFTENEASNFGGAIFVGEDGNLRVRDTYADRCGCCCLRCVLHGCIYVCLNCLGQLFTVCLQY